MLEKNTLSKNVLASHLQKGGTGISKGHLHWGMLTQPTSLS
jgi:hypothetical protein